MSARASTVRESSHCSGAPYWGVPTNCPEIVRVWFDRPRREILDRARQMIWMGQQLNNPPSVEGWHQGVEWVDTGTLVERINFASEQFGDAEKPGVRSMIDRVIAPNGDGQSAESLVDACLDQMGALSVADDTKSILLAYAEKSGVAASQGGVEAGDWIGHCVVLGIRGSDRVQHPRVGR